LNKVVLSEIAEIDLIDIWSFVARDDPTAADRLIDQIHDRFRLLAATPKMGRLRPELNESIRSFVVAQYVIFYRKGARLIEVARVLHGHRDIPSLFRP
jgi:toxin ParE1/3/4